MAHTVTAVDESSEYRPSSRSSKSPRASPDHDLDNTRDLEHSDHEEHPENEEPKKTKKAKKEPTVKDEIRDELAKWQRKQQQERAREKSDLEKTKKQMENTKKEDEKQQRDDVIKQLEQKLLEAARNEDVKKLRQGVTEVEDAQLEAEFGDAYDDAKLMIRSAERVDAARPAQRRITQAMVSEIRSFKRPQDVVYDVAKATLLVLGYDDSVLKDWPTSRREFIVSGRDAMNKKIASYDSGKLRVDAASRAIRFVDRHERDDAYVVCQAVGTFYDWAAGVAEECLSCDRKEMQRRKKDFRQQQNKRRADHKKLEDERRLEQTKKPTSAKRR